MEPSTGQLQDALSKNFQELSPQLQQAARYVMENPQDVATRSLRQIALLSGLSPPTFSRLARAVGFNEYESFKDICRSELKRSSMSLAERAFEMQDSAGSAKQMRGSFAQSHAASSIENISDLITKIDLDHLADVADHLAKAKKVGLLGALSSQVALEYFHHMMSLANPGWSIMTEGQLSTSVFLSEVNEDTIILAVSIKPYINRTVQVAQLAAKQGATIIAITDDIASPILQHSKHSFLVSTESPQFFPSYVAPLTLLEILAGMLVRRWGEKANKRIDSVEQTSHAIGDYI